jgi:hypothetical protein
MRVLILMIDYNVLSMYNFIILLLLVIIQLTFSSLLSIKSKMKLKSL